jgi:hypothetical protein
LVRRVALNSRSAKQAFLSMFSEWIDPLRWFAMAAAAVAVLGTNGAVRQAGGLRRRPVRQPETGERHAGEADAELLECGAAGDGPGEAPGELIKLVVHIAFRFLCCLVLPTHRRWAGGIRAGSDHTAHASAKVATGLNRTVFCTGACAPAIVTTKAATTVRVGSTGLGVFCALSRPGFVCQPETGQSHSNDRDAEFLKRRPARDRLSQAFSEFIEFVVHEFFFYLDCLSAAETLIAARCDRRCW